MDSWPHYMIPCYITVFQTDCHAHNLQVTAETVQTILDRNWTVLTAEVMSSDLKKQITSLKVGIHSVRAAARPDK